MSSHDHSSEAFYQQDTAIDIHEPSSTDHVAILVNSHYPRPAAAEDKKQTSPLSKNSAIEGAFLFEEFLKMDEGARQHISLDEAERFRAFLKRYPQATEVDIARATYAYFMFLNIEYDLQRMEKADPSTRGFRWKQFFAQLAATIGVGVEPLYAYFLGKAAAGAIAEYGHQLGWQGSSVPNIANYLGGSTLAGFNLIGDVTSVAFTEEAQELIHPDRKAREAAAKRALEKLASVKKALATTNLAMATLFSFPVLAGADVEALQDWFGKYAALVGVTGGLVDFAGVVYYWMFSGAKFSVHASRFVDFISSLKNPLPSIGADIINCRNPLPSTETLKGTLLEVPTVLTVATRVLLNSGYRTLSTFAIASMLSDKVFNISAEYQKGALGVMGFVSAVTFWVTLFTRTTQVIDSFYKKYDDEIQPEDYAKAKVPTSTIVYDLAIAAVRNAPSAVLLYYGGGAALASRIAAGVLGGGALFAADFYAQYRRDKQDQARDLPEVKARIKARKDADKKKAKNDSEAFDRIVKEAEDNNNPEATLYLLEQAVTLRIPSLIERLRAVAWNQCIRAANGEQSKWTQCINCFTRTSKVGYSHELAEKAKAAGYFELEAALLKIEATQKSSGTVEDANTSLMESGRLAELSSGPAPDANKPEGIPKGLSEIVVVPMNGASSGASHQTSSTSSLIPNPAPAHEEEDDEEHDEEKDIQPTEDEIAVKYYDHIQTEMLTDKVKSTITGINLASRSTRVLGFQGFLSGLLSVFNEYIDPNKDTLSLDFKTRALLAGMLGIPVALADGPVFQELMEGVISYYLAKKAIGSPTDAIAKRGAFGRFWGTLFTPKEEYDINRIRDVLIQRILDDEEKVQANYEKLMAEAAKQQYVPRPVKEFKDLPKKLRDKPNAKEEYAALLKSHIEGLNHTIRYHKKYDPVLVARLEKLRDQETEALKTLTKPAVGVAPTPTSTQSSSSPSTNVLSPRQTTASPALSDAFSDAEDHPEYKEKKSVKLSKVKTSTQDSLWNFDDLFSEEGAHGKTTPPLSPNKGGITSPSSSSSIATNGNGRLFSPTQASREQKSSHPAPRNGHLFTENRPKFLARWIKMHVSAIENMQADIDKGGIKKEEVRQLRDISIPNTITQLEFVVKELLRSFSLSPECQKITKDFAKQPDCLKKTWKKVEKQLAEEMGQKPAIEKRKHSEGTINRL